MAVWDPAAFVPQMKPDRHGSFFPRILLDISKVSSSPGGVWVRNCVVTRASLTSGSLGLLMLGSGTGEAFWGGGAAGRGCFHTKDALQTNLLQPRGSREVGVGGETPRLSELPPLKAGP